MKKIVLALFVILITSGSAIAQQQQPQAGIPSAQYVPLHGHTNELDGGKLNIPSAYVGYPGGLTVTSGSPTLIPLNSKVVDTGNWFNTSTNKYTPLSSGNYYVILELCGTGATTLTQIQIMIYKNGGQVTSQQLNASFTAGAYECTNTSYIAQMNGSTDFLQGYAMLTGTGTLTIQSAKISILRISN